RARDEEHARARLRETLARLYDEPPEAAARVSAVRGDLLAPALGLSARARDALVASVDRIVHCAASISFDLPLAHAREINVGGVRRVLELAREIHARGSLRRLVHVSTAYVSGRHAGTFREQDLDVGQHFRNTYERSKHEAELLLRVRAGELPLALARPSIVVGHSASGWTSAFNVLYWPMRAFERGLLHEVPAREDSIVDFVPVDYVTDGVLALLDHEDVHGTYALVAGELALSAAQLVRLHATLTAREPVRFVEQPDERALPAGGETFAPYFDVRCRFEDARAREMLGRAGIEKPDPREYFERLLAFARHAAWGKRVVSREAAFAHDRARGDAPAWTSTPSASRRRRPSASSPG
ncbi:MAG TPA: SDR family oxidoreductase, partial [Solirubrobacteraceae bacterium]|nr:SDR family oxidoreductase [Solirubrobacteraceae bacterium]